MGVSDAKNWKTEEQQSLNFGNASSRPRCMGEAKDAGERNGNESFFLSREDSQRGYPSIGRGGASQEITGKSINALIEETEAQLNYHKEQVNILESRLEDIRHTAKLLEEEDNK